MMCLGYHELDKQNSRIDIGHTLLGWKLHMRVLIVSKLPSKLKIVFQASLYHLAEQNNNHKQNQCRLQTSFFPFFSLPRN